MYGNFHEDDIIIVSSVILRTKAATIDYFCGRLVVDYFVD